MRSHPAGPRRLGTDGPTRTRTTPRPRHQLGSHFQTELAATAPRRTRTARQQHRARPQAGLTRTASLSDLSPTWITGHGPRSQQTRTGGAGSPALPATQSWPRQHSQRRPAAKPRQPNSDRAPEQVTDNSARAARSRRFQELETNLTWRHGPWQHRADGGPEPVTNNSAKAAPTERPPGIKLD